MITDFRLTIPLHAGRIFLALALFAIIMPRQSGAMVVDALGDSITSGVPYYTSTDGNGCLPPCGGYEPALQNLFINSGRSAAVRNFGVRGEFSSGGVNRIDRVMTTTHPNYILLLEGTNDILWYSPTTVKSNVSLMIDKALARSVTPVIGTLTRDTITTYKPINETNSMLRNLAAQKGVPLADLYSATSSNWAAYTSDGLHPNQAGYTVMARTWFNAMVSWEAQHQMKTTSYLPAIHLLLLDN